MSTGDLLEDKPAPSLAETTVKANSDSCMQLGALVGLHGLKAKPELNGQIGYLESKDVERWGVRLRIGSGKVSIKPANLTLLPRRVCGACGDAKQCICYFKDEWERS